MEGASAASGTKYRNEVEPGEARPGKRVMNGEGHAPIKKRSKNEFEALYMDIFFS
jgi:hypothetical protein